MNDIILYPQRVTNRGPKRGRRIQCCHGCSDIKEKLYDLSGTNLGLAFTELTGLQVPCGQVCYICAHLLKRFHNFRDRCLKTSYVLRQAGALNEDLCTLPIDTTNLKHNINKSDVLTLTYDPQTEHEMNVESDAEIDCIDLSSDDEIKTEQTDIGNNPDNVKIEYAFIDPLHIKSQHFDDIKTTFDNKEKNNVICDEFNTNIDVINENIDVNSEDNVATEVINENESFDDDFTWPDDENDFFCNDLSAVDGIDVNDSQDHDENNYQRFLEIEEKFKEKIKKRNVQRHLADHDYNMDHTKSLEEFELMSEHSLVKNEISKVFLRFVEKIKHNEMNCYELFENIHKESLVFTMDFDDEESDESKVLIWKYLCLHKRLEDIGGLNIEFSSIEKQYQELEEKRKSGLYETEHCNMCCKTYRHDETLQRHVSSQHNPMFKFECKVCLYRCKTQTLLASHVRYAHSQRATCSHCGVYFCGRLQWCGLIEHKKVHEGIKLVCEFCSKTFTFSKLLAMHLRKVHRNKMDVICLLCGDIFNGPQGLRTHIRMHGEAVKCKKCKIYFKNEDVLNIHCKDGGCVIGTSSCTVCGANFTTKELMMQHYFEKCSTPIKKKKIIKVKKIKKFKKKIEKKEKGRSRSNLMCEICGKDGFPVVAKLMYHQRIHSGEKPFNCDFCDKTFRLRISLNHHLATHTGERKYKCRLCPASFKQPAHLHSHMPSHTKEKRYFCDICSKRFQHRASMLEHKRMIHEGLPSKYRKPKIK